MAGGWPARARDAHLVTDEQSDDRGVFERYVGTRWPLSGIEGCPVREQRTAYESSR